MCCSCLGFQLDPPVRALRPKRRARMARTSLLSKAGSSGKSRELVLAGHSSDPDPPVCNRPCSWSAWCQSCSRLARGESGFWSWPFLSLSPHPVLGPSAGQQIAHRCTKVQCLPKSVISSDYNMFSDFRWSFGLCRRHSSNNFAIPGRLT